MSRGLLPAEYAWKWLSGDLRFQDEQAAMAELRRWLDFYRTNGIARVSGGFMVVQKCETGGEWTRVDSRAAGDFGSRGGVELLRVLANTTWLETGPDLLTACYTVPEGVRAEVGMALSGGGWERQTIRLTSPERLSYDGQVDENILRLLDLAREGKSAATSAKSSR